MRVLLRETLPFLLLVSCRAGDAQHDVQHVQQATLVDHAADEVFGQPDLTSHNVPTTLDGQSLLAPVAIATDGQFRAGSNMFYVLDRDAHRALAITGSASAASWAIGQRTLADGSPNSGYTFVSSSGFSAPNGLAIGGSTVPTSGTNYVVIADTGNHRVLYGTGFYSMPWTASGVLGQRGSTTSNTPNVGGIGDQTMNGPQGVALCFDPTNPFNDPVLFVADTGNNRVLQFKGFAAAPVAVFGQAGYDTSAPNRGGDVGPVTFDGPTGLGCGTTSTGSTNFYVADTQNNRVLAYGTAGGTGPMAVYGQGGDFTTNTPNKGGLSAASLALPTGVAVDKDGGLYIADTGNNRVLHYPIGATVADRVLGQPDFNTATVLAPAPGTMNAPRGVAVTATGDLLVADTGNGRVLRFVKGCEGTCDDGDPCTNDFCNPVSGCTHQTTPFSTACAPYRCDIPTHSCMHSCANVSDCDPSSRPTCRNSVCVSVCSTDAECKSGFCSDGLCCNVACDGPCESCSRTGYEGSCVPLPLGPPKHACSVTVEGECGTRCDGTDGKACKVAPKGSACGNESCNDGEQVSRGVCDGTGVCHTEIHSCAPYTCTSARCRTDCVFDYECTAGARCVEGECHPTFGAEGGGGGCAFGQARAASSVFGFLLVCCALVSRRRT